MAIIANNIRISSSSKVTENQTFDLTALFLRSPLLSSDSFFRPNGGALNTDPYFTILDDPLGIFQIDADTGDVSFNQDVTLEMDTEYKVVIKAYEKRSPE